MSKKRSDPTLGGFVRERRAGKRMTLRALARAVGVSAPFMSDIEHNRRAPSDGTLDKMAKVLGCRRSELAKRTSLRRDLVSWIRDNPELEALLRDMKESERPMIGGERCPCCMRPLP